ncbi:hypothetical protein DDE05_39980 [Streptomyces cavourensis]|nr:hypothetical protein DDE05_39980 [Streptomyces cavourensis]
MALRRVALGLCALTTSWGADAQQGPVTLYGVMDLSLAGFSTQERGTALNMQSGVQSGSRWGLRGSEDLGGGLRANFQLESGILANNGRSAQGGRLFGRAAWVGVSGASASFAWAVRPRYRPPRWPTTMRFRRRT